MGLFTFWSKLKSLARAADCSVMLFSDNLDTEKGKDIVFTIGVCNNGSEEVTLGAMEMFLTFDNNELTYSSFDDRIGGVKASFPLKHDENGHIRISRYGVGVKLPANSTYMIGTVNISTKDAVKGKSYEIYANECSQLSYEGYSLNVPQETNKLTFNIK